ncbi:MAG: DUF3365 domain-containing protein [Melioribacteraceae bacterium]|nr:DUF3365 domain-containing protein [Melioribacteraceae bacterium]
MKNIYLIGAIIITLVVIGCQNKTDEVDNPELKSELENYADSYMSELKSVLMQNMKAGGPLKAVNVCSDTAAQLTSSFSERMGVQVKRFSIKNRNSENYPDKFEQEFLEYFEQLQSTDRLSADSHLLKRVESEGKYNLIFVKPIVIAAPCLNCHGSEDQISDEVNLVLQEKYPNDKATGYNIGDLRGAISVTKAL